MLFIVKTNSAQKKKNCVVHRTMKSLVLSRQKKIVARRVKFSVKLVEQMQSSNNGIYRQKLFLS